MEAIAASGVPLRYALKEGLKISLPSCWMIYLGGKPSVLTGVSPYPLHEGTGIVWMLGSADIEQYPKLFHILSQQVLKDMFAFYPRLTNVVDVRNTTHVLWLRRLGFNFTKLHQKWGPFGLPFFEFERTIKNNV
jgi:hypothetical protein